MLPGKRTDLFLETSDWGGTERWSSIELFPYLPKHIAQRKQDILINQVCCLKIAPSSGEYGQAVAQGYEAFDTASHAGRGSGPTLVRARPMPVGSAEIIYSSF